MKRNVFLLSISQAVMITCTSLMLTSSALVGRSLAENKALATLPFAMLFLSQMLTTIPASFYMGTVGRRLGFMTSALFGLAGATVTTVAIFHGSFILFCSGTILIGVFNGFGQYYRFAAAEVATEEYRSRAISFALAGGVLAAFAGPNLANWSRQVLSVEFAGNFACLILLYFLSFWVATLLRIQRPARVSQKQGGRSLGAVAGQRAYLVAVISAMVGYGAMNFIMIATPLAMQSYSHSFPQTAFVIQWHILGMFVPSFFTGHLIRRFGAANVMLVGILFVTLCIGMNISGTSVRHFWIGLLFLGLGWNFLFIGATTLLTQTYSSIEKSKAQALNDFMVFGTVSMTSFSSGAVQHALGWHIVNLAVLPFLVIIFIANIWLRRKYQPKLQ
jgi:MFS family permease